MAFEDRCLLDFDPGVVARGAAYFRQGRIVPGPAINDALLAIVKGTSGAYQVLLDWSDVSSGIVEAACTCPYFDDVGLCKHIWATMLAADARGLGPRSGRQRLTAVETDPPDGDLDYDEPEDLDDDFPGPRTLPLGRGDGGPSRLPPPAPPPAPTWRHRLSSLFQGPRPWESPAAVLPSLDRSREAWYVIDVASSRTDGSLIIEFFQRETKQNGEFGKLKQASLREADLDRFPIPEDREMLRLLLDHHGDADESYGYYRHYSPRVSEVSLEPRMYGEVLPKLYATGRLACVLDSSRQDPDRDRRPLVWDGGPPWRFRLSLEADDAKERWIFHGELVREGTEAVVPVKVPVLLLDGVVLIEDCLARFESGDFLPWIEALRNGPAIEVPYQDRWDLLDRFWQLSSPPEMNLPANLRCEEIRLAPRGRLIIHAKKEYGPNRLYAHVEFRYGDKTVRARDRFAGMVDARQQQVLVRDFDKEAELLRFLGDRGVRPAEAYADRDGDVWISPQRLSDVVDALLAADWIVEAEGHPIRKAGQFRLSVTSGIDWFDLEGTCDFDGVAVELPLLLEAVRRGEKYVRLGDGSRGLLPQEWLARFAGMADLVAAEEGRIRFRTSQALLLDALLAAQEQVSFDKRFTEIRRKLRSFRGVAPGKEPRGFHGELRNYQKEGLGWLNFLRDFSLGGCLADDMGLGKTVQVLALLQARRMRKNGDGGKAPSLVVVPRSLVFNWIEEARRFAPNLRVLDYTGLQRESLLEQVEGHDLVVTTYDTLRRDIARLKDIRFDYAILDESQAIKNAQSQRAKACRLLQADHRLAMTGTPVENHLGELWSLFEFLNPGMLGSSSAFQRISKTATADSEDLAMLRRALAPFVLRRTKAQVLTELPEKTEQTLYCDLEGKQRKYYHELRDYYRKMLSERIQKTGLAKAKIHVLEALLRLRQAACHPGLIDKDRLDESSVKLDALLEQLKEVIDEGHKALVFSQFTSFLSIVRRRLDAEKITYEYLDGQTTDRKSKVDRFQGDATCPLFLISLKAGGHGLNLTAADYVFILDPWWNPAVESQAIDRTHRIGQTRHVFAYRLIVRDTVEEKVIELQKSKRDLAEAIISADDNILRKLTAQDLEMLLS